CASGSSWSSSTVGSSGRGRSPCGTGPRGRAADAREGERASRAAAREQGADAREQRRSRATPLRVGRRVCETAGMTDRAGTPAQESDLIDVDEVLAAYTAPATQPAVFGTSAHRGSSLDGALNEAHIAAITQPIVEYRATQGVTGPANAAADTHALSRPARAAALGVPAASGVAASVVAAAGFVPTPALARAFIRHNRERASGAAGPAAGAADGIVVSPSHNPPRDGGF